MKIFQIYQSEQRSKHISQRVLFRGSWLGVNEDYDLAAAYLETAYCFEPHNQPTIKAQGYAYLWRGKFDDAAKLFQQVEFKVELVSELRYYHWYWGTRQRDDLSKMALQMADALQR